MTLRLQSGLDLVHTNPDLIRNLGKIGLVTNQSVASFSNKSALEVIASATKKTMGSTLVAVFGPQHGYGQTEQDNMIETADTVIKINDSTLPLYSLYSKSRAPTDEQLLDLDTLIVDLIDVGCRIYTYMLTLAACMRQAAKLGKKVIVLDRPNPLGLSFEDQALGWQRIEGNTLNTQLESFVGWYPIPERHGLSMGELGAYFQEHDKLTLDYSVIKVEGLSRNTTCQELKTFPWNLPSPNLSSWEGTYFFPAFVLLEGTNVSEGRGTTQPFQTVGAPWLNNSAAKIWLEEKLPTLTVGIREHQFRPTFNKYKGEVCKGLHFLSGEKETPSLFEIGIWFITFCKIHHTKDFNWAPKGYEYNFTDSPIDLILGTKKWRELWDKALYSTEQDSSAQVEALLKECKADSQLFGSQTKKHHIYN